MITIDGSQGEGGGQILRTSLALSVITQQPVKIVKIRAQRSNPGLQRQHLAAVKAAAAVGNASLKGAELNSRELVFRPEGMHGGTYRFEIGTAGSASLVLQTVLPCLLLADRPSEVVITGGTHNPLAPPYEFLACAFLPRLAQLGGQVELHLERYGFYPRGGGELRASIQPFADRSRRLELASRGEMRSRQAHAMISRLPRHVAERELAIVSAELGWTGQALQIVELEGAGATANLLQATLDFEHVTEVVTEFGERGVRAETIAERLAAAVKEYLRHGAPVGEHLADQLLLPCALTGGGSYTTGVLSLHARTNIDVIRAFLPVSIAVTEQSTQVWQIDIDPRR